VYTFRDYYNNEVKLSFADHPFSKCPKHVLIICRYKGQWLLTDHQERGFEFPGGKVEKGESPKEGAIREVKEETGAIIEEIDYVGQYFVNGKNGSVFKNIYFSNVTELRTQETYYETNGPILLDRIPNDIKTNDSYSFIMKDEILDYTLDYILKTKD